jgi:hypothetical protein
VGSWRLLVVLCACGRLGFDPVGGTSPNGDDGPAGGEPFMPPACASADGVLLCDGFEPGTTIAWAPVMGNGTVAMSTERAHTGSRSLRAEGTMGRTVAFMSAPIATVTTGEIHLRGWFYRPSTATATDIYLARIGDGIANTEFFGVTGGANPGVDSGAGSSFVPPVLTADTWVCVEIHVAGTTLSLDIDGTQVTEVVLGTFGPYSQVAFGIVADVGNPDTFLIFVDDVVARTQPIGCAL